MQKMSFRLKLLAALTAVMLVFTGCGLALYFGTSATETTSMSAEKAAASGHVASTATCYATVYKNNTAWAHTRNGVSYGEDKNNRYVTINSTHYIKVIEAGTVTLYSPVYGFYAPNVLECFSKTDGSAYALHYRVQGYLNNVISMYDYVEFKGVKLQSNESGVWSETFTFEGKFYVNDPCLNTNSTGFLNLVETTDSFAAHFCKRCWTWRYWEPGVKNALIMGRAAAIDYYGEGTDHRNVIMASTYQYIKAKDDAGTALPPLYFLMGNGKDFSNKVSNTAARYNGLTYACVPEYGTDGHINYWFSNTTSSPFPQYYLIELEGPFTIGGFTLDHTVRWYNPTDSSPSGTIWTVHSDSYQDSISGVTHFAKESSGLRLKVNNVVKYVSGIRIYTNTNMDFGVATAEMYDYLKISDYAGYAPTPLIPTQQEGGGASSYFHFPVNSSGYSIVSVDGVAFWIIWIEIDGSGNVTDILQALVDSDAGSGFHASNHLENFTIIIRKGFARNRVKYTKTFTYVGKDDNTFELWATNACSRIVLNNERSAYRLYEYGTTATIRGDNVTYDDDLNCYVVHTAYTYNIVGHDKYSLFHVTLYTLKEDNDESQTVRQVAYSTMDNKTRCNTGDKFVYDNEGAGTYNLGIAIFYKGDGPSGDWMDDGYAMIYLGAVGSDTIIIKLYCDTPEIENLTAVSGGEIVDGDIKVTGETGVFTFDSIQPFTPHSYAGTLANVDIAYTWSAGKYHNTLTIAREATLGCNALVIRELNGYVSAGTVYGASYTYKVRSSHSFAYALNLSSTMNMMFATETVGGDYTVAYAKVTDWKGKNYDLTSTQRTAGGKTIWTFANVSPHNAADMVNFSVRLSYDNGVDVYNEDYSVSKSIVGYCYDVLKNTNYAGEYELLTLMVDTLHYCSRAYEFVYSGSTCNWDATSSIEACANIGSGNAGNYTNAYNAAMVANKFHQDSGVKDGNTTTGIRMAYISAQVVVEGNPYINIVVAANSTFETGVTYTATVNGETVDIEFVNTGVTYKQDYIYLYSAKISLAPTQFDDAIVITCTHTASSKAMSLTYSVNSYVKRLASGAREEACARAMYSYGKSAKDYAEFLSGYSEFV